VPFAPSHARPLPPATPQLGAALAAAGGRPFDRAYSSDLLRAAQTAAALAAAAGIPPDCVHQDQGLRERDVGGLLAGLTRAEAAVAQPAAWRALGSADPAAPLPGGGESLDALRARVAAALERIAVRHPGGALAPVAGVGIQPWRSTGDCSRVRRRVPGLDPSAGSSPAIQEQALPAAARRARVHGACKHANAHVRG
jgi:hypothetical protein